MGLINTMILKNIKLIRSDKSNYVMIILLCKPIIFRYYAGMSHRLTLIIYFIGSIISDMYRKVDK